MKLSIRVLNEKLENGRLNVQRLDLEKVGSNYATPENVLFPLFFVIDGIVVIAENDEKILSHDMIALQLS